ncbi:MAG TPA: acyl-CoA dehydrogenase family protein [Acidimicrobiales bacterium]|jgi:alkylation response protein AidB-like acyl-CoA dehydrogenase|nr:acyl-CoA dehydrogenase family protein [Acidimicrobiales bacterium]
MDLALSADQSELQRTARRFAAERLAPDAPADRAWSDLGELGWFAMGVPESRGGAGASAFDLAVVFEELGRVAASSLVFDTAVLAPAVLAVLDDTWASDAIGRIAAGAARIAVLVDDGIGLPSDRATSVEMLPSSRALSGTSALVGDAMSATHVLALARAGSDTVVALVDVGADGVQRTAQHGFVPGHFGVDLSAAVPAAWSTIAPEQLRRAVLGAVPILCAYQVGSCQTAYEMSVAYSRERVQFGKPIGTYQRVQDHIIDLVNGTDSARWVTNHAIWVTETSDDPDMAVHVAKAVTAEAHVAACVSAHEVHAGIGADLQYGLARHTFASRSLYARLGDPAWHRRQIAGRLAAAMSA